MTTAPVSVRMGSPNTTHGELTNGRRQTAARSAGEAQPAGISGRGRGDRPHGAAASGGRFPSDADIRRSSLPSNSSTARTRCEHLLCNRSVSISCPVRARRRNATLSATSCNKRRRRLSMRRLPGDRVGTAMTTAPVSVRMGSPNTIHGEFDDPNTSKNSHSASDVRGRCRHCGEPRRWPADGFGDDSRASRRSDHRPSPVGQNFSRKSRLAPYENDAARHCPFARKHNRASRAWLLIDRRSPSHLPTCTLRRSDHPDSRRGRSLKIGNCGAVRDLGRVASRIDPYTVTISAMRRLRAVGERGKVIEIVGRHSAMGGQVNIDHLLRARDLQPTLPFPE